MLNDVPVVWQYVIMSGFALAATLIGLWLYNRREKRRKHALEMGDIMKEWGLKWFAEGYDMYAVGDYSGLAHKVKEVVKAVRSDEAMAAKLMDVTRKVCTHVAFSDPTKAAELIAILTAKPTPPRVLGSSRGRAVGPSADEGAVFAYTTRFCAGK